MKHENAFIECLKGMLNINRGAGVQLMIRKKYFRAAANAGGNGENKQHPAVKRVSCLLTKLFHLPAVLLLSFATAVHAGNAAQGVPTLDDLAGDWMEVAAIRNFPSVNNFRGALKTHSNLTTFLFATFPPYANGGYSGMLSSNGKSVTATESRWYPYQVLRRATVDGIEMESAIRMPFEQRGVLCRLTIKNTTAKPQTLDLSWAFSGQVCRYPDASWATWASPHGEVGNAIAVVGTEAKVLSAVGNKGSVPAAIAFAFSQAPADLKVVTDGGVATWKINLAPNQTISLAYTTAMDKESAAATELATRWAKSFDQSFALAKTQWEERWQAAFKPGNKHFSGHLPGLVTDDAKIRRVYFHGLLAPMLLCRTDLPASSRCFVTLGPEWGCSLMYFWDAEMWANSWAMLEPATMKELLKKWLALNIHGCYAFDCVSGNGAGPWYGANDWCVFRCIEAYVNVTGDTGFFQEQVNGKTVLQHVEDLATSYRQRQGKDTVLADYGEANNLLECSPTYVNYVPSLNAANVYMLCRTGDILDADQKKEHAAELRVEAAKLRTAVMNLYIPGEGVWNAVHRDGKYAQMRHCFDYIMIGQAMENDLSPGIKMEMTKFVGNELITRTWMRAMSLKDSAAEKSDRPDHGPMGSYDAWPALTIDVMCRFGFFDKAVAFLRNAEAVTHEGSFAQSHEFLGPESRGTDPVVRIANRGGQDYNAVCGGAFAEAIIRAVFGFRPDRAVVGDKPALLLPDVPRGFTGVLEHVPWHGKLYSIISDAKGVSISEEHK